MGWLFSNRPERPQESGEAASGVQLVPPPERLRWTEICTLADYRGRWVALDECEYDAAGKAREGAVVDTDEDLSVLCQRLRDQERKHCAVLFCEVASTSAASDPASDDPFAHSAHR